jgi:hypothetical protein
MTIDLISHILAECDKNAVPTCYMSDGTKSALRPQAVLAAAAPDPPEDYANPGIGADQLGSPSAGVIAERGLRAIAHMIKPDTPLGLDVQQRMKEIIMLAAPRLQVDLFAKTFWQIVQCLADRDRMRPSPALQILGIDTHTGPQDTLKFIADVAQRSKTGTTQLGFAAYLFDSDRVGTDLPIAYLITTLISKIIGDDPFSRSLRELLLENNTEGVTVDELCAVMNELWAAQVRARNVPHATEVDPEVDCALSAAGSSSRRTGRHGERQVQFTKGILKNTATSETEDSETGESETGESETDDTLEGFLSGLEDLIATTRSKAKSRSRPPKSAKDSKPPAPQSAMAMVATPYADDIHVAALRAELESLRDQVARQAEPQLMYYLTEQTDELSPTDMVKIRDQLNAIGADAEESKTRPLGERV